MATIQRRGGLAAAVLLFSIYNAGLADPPRVTKITVYPTQRILSQKNHQQLAVTAHFNNGSLRDVTRLALYESTDPKIAGASGTGLVSTFNFGGEAWILVRYGGKFARFRCIVSTPEHVPAYNFPEQTLVDRHTHLQWQRRGLVPSALCTDEEFIRRATLQLTGLAPSSEEIKSFLEDNDPRKRAHLIDRLLASSEHHTHFANLWADALRTPHITDLRKGYEAHTFYRWIRKSVAQDRGLDVLVRELLESRGNAAIAPAVYWYACAPKPQQLAEDTAELFLGVPLHCIKCHRHPYEDWDRQSYLGMAAFFGQVNRKQIRVPAKLRSRVALYHQTKLWQIEPQFKKKFLDPQTRKEIQPRFVDSEPLHYSPFDDPRRLLCEEILDEHDPVFARAIVNRYWTYFFGKGIVDPPGDTRVSNPPSNPELLDALAQDFIKHGYSTRHLLQTICKSRTYQLSSVANKYNAGDQHCFSRFYPQTMPADIFFDVICQLSKDYPTVKHIVDARQFHRRATLFRPEGYRSSFFQPWPEKNRSGECDRDVPRKPAAADLAELLASAPMQAKFHKRGGWIQQLAVSSRSDQGKVEEIFLSILGKNPTAAQRDGALQFIERSRNKREAYEQLINALLRTEQFLLIR